MSFSEKLQRLRKENKLSQEQLADMLDVTRQSVSKWESGTTYPEMDKLITMCKIFKCSLDDLTNDEITEINVSNKKNNQFNNILDSLLELIKKSILMFSSMKFSKVIGTIFSLIGLGIILLIIRIPFDLIEEALYELIDCIGIDTLERFLRGIFVFALDSIFLILYILIYVYIYKIAFLDRYEFVDAKKIIVENPQTVEEKEAPEKIIVRENKQSSNTVFHALGTVISYFVKFLLLCFLMPIFFITLGLLALLAIDIHLMVEGVVYIGFLLAIIFAIVIAIVIIELIISFIFNHNPSFKRLLWTFIISLCGIGISSGIIAVEVANTEYIDELTPAITQNTIEKTYAMNENLNLPADYMYQDYYYYYHSSIEYIENENMTDEVKVSVTYSDMFNNINIEKNEDESIHIQNDYISDFNTFKKVLDLVIEDLKEKRLYNYGEIDHINITIETSKENIETIKKNNNNISKKLYDEEMARIEAENRCDDERQQYESMIYDLQEKEADYLNKIDNLEYENETLKAKLQEYKDQINNILAE